MKESVNVKILISLFIIVIIIFVSGCSGSNETISIKSSMWQLDSLTGIKKPPPGRNSTIEFDSKGGVKGNGGCNTYSGSYTTESNTLKISKIMSTEMSCENLHVEANFFSALQKTDKYKISGNILRLYSEGNVIAILHKQMEP